MPYTAMTINRLEIPGKRDVATREYFAWQEEQGKGEEQKAHYRKAFNYLIEEGIDIELIYQDEAFPDDLNTKAGVKRGVA